MHVTVKFSKIKIPLKMTVQMAFNVYVHLFQTDHFITLLKKDDNIFKRKAYAKLTVTRHCVKRDGKRGEGGERRGGREIESTMGERKVRINKDTLRKHVSI